MSVVDPEWRPFARRLGRIVFGDRVGLAIWLGLVVVLGLTWRIGFFITDTYAVANTFVNVADGHLAITENRYSLTLGSQPGLHEHDGRLYGRNYGQVVLALPVLWLLQASTVLAPLHLVIAGGWSVAILAFFRQVATVLDRQSLRPAGIAVALGAFAVNVARGATIDPHFLPLAALQLGSLFAAAFAGVLCYRLVGVFHDESVATAAGVAVVVAFPLGFWASIPKRHVLVATLLLASVYCFARSRQASGREAHLAIAGAYVAASLVAWVHAFEGFFALAVLGSVDVLTGGVRNRRRLAVICCATVVGLIPMFLTNALISGTPLQPPRLLPNLGTGSVELAPSGEIRAPDGGSGGAEGGGSSDPMGSSGGSESSSSAENGDRAGNGNSAEDGGGTGDANGSGSERLLDVVATMLGPLRGPFARVGFVVAFVTQTVGDGIDVLGAPERLWHVFVRSGRIPGLRYAVNDYEMIDLTVVESAPVLGALAALPAVVAGGFRAAVRRRRRLPTGRDFVPWSLSPRRQTDLLVVALGVVLTVVYLSRLPLFSMITVRYIVYAMPFWLYGVVRLPPIRAAITDSPARLGLAFGAAAIGGLVAFSVALSSLDVALGEAMQFHALVNLAAGTVVCLLVVGRALVPGRVPVRVLTVALGVTVGLTTAFVLLAGVEYFQYGQFALGVSRQLSATIPIR